MGVDQEIARLRAELDRLRRAVRRAKGVLEEWPLSVERCLPPESPVVVAASILGEALAA